MKLIFALSVFFLVACSSKPKTEPAPEPSAPPVRDLQGDDQLIYDALNVKEVDARVRDENGHPALGTMVFKKTVGGLICRKTTVVSPDGQPKFSCEKGALNGRAIYKALQAEERTSKGAKKRSSVWTKKVGVLTCTKTKASKKAKPKFACKIEI